MINGYSLVVEQFVPGSNPRAPLTLLGQLFCISGPV